MLAKWLLRRSLTLRAHSDMVCPASTVSTL
nr:MAG TPA_asm: hypothetical protein [Caudoviricetes sp.]